VSTTLFVFSVFSSAVASETFNGKTYYFGDLHAHTGVSYDGVAADGGQGVMGTQEWESASRACTTFPPASTTICGTIGASAATLFDTSDANHLDFLALTDHNTSNATRASDFDSLLSHGLAEDAARSDFVFIPSAELNHEDTVRRFGHKNMYVFADGSVTGLDMADFDTIPTITDGDCAGIWTNAASMDSTFGNVLMWAHHPSAAQNETTTWSCHDDAYEPVVEIYSGYGNALWDGHAYDLVYQPADPYSDDAPTSESYIIDALDGSYTQYGNGLNAVPLKVGFVAGTDLHDSRPGEVCDTQTRYGTAHQYGGGLTMIAVDSNEIDAEDGLVRSQIYDALWARESMVTTGPRIPVEVYWDLDGGGTSSIGKEVTGVSTSGSTSTYLRVLVPNTYEAYITSVTAIGPDNADMGTAPQTYSATEATGSSYSTWSYQFNNAYIPTWVYVEIRISGASASSYYTANGTTGCLYNDGGANGDEYIWASPTWFSH